MGKVFFMPFRSMLAKRMFALFLLCTALPLLLIAVVADFHVRNYLQKRIAREFRATSRVYETVVFDVLLLFENQFLGRLADDPPPNLARPALEPEKSPGPDLFFLEAGRLAERQPPFPPLTPTEQTFLEEGRVLIRQTQTEADGAGLAMFAKAQDEIFYGLADLDYLRQRMADYGEWGGVHLALLLEDGTSIASSDPAPTLPAGWSLAAAGDKRFDLVGLVDGQPCIGVVNTIFLKGRFGTPNWQLLMLKSQREIFEPLATFRRTLYLMMLIAVVGICLFMLVSIRRHTRQLEALEEGTEKIRHQNFEHTINIRRGDEFEPLAQAFNTMTRSLHDYRRNLARQNDELRQKVDEIRLAREKEKVMQAQLSRAEHLESLGKLAGGIAHDFNNLLSVILAHAEMAQLELPEDSPARESLAHINTASEKATELCRQMMVYAGKGNYAFEPIDLASTIREISDLMRASVGKYIQLTYEIDDPPPQVNGDPSQILQVVLNFITNAAAAIGKQPGEIIVRVGIKSCTAEALRSTCLQTQLAAGNYACLQVADNGCGMDQDMLDKIFDPFFTTKEVGHGLGLATVLGIVKAHHGTIQVDSQLGHGTTFTVLLPLLDTP